MAKFAVQINSAPWQGEGCDTAYQFIRAALRRGHEILRVFFYYEGAYHGLGGMAPPEDEKPSIRRWSDLAAEHGIDLVVCVSAAARRGLAEPVESGPRNAPVAKGFRLAGLGLWMEACLKADRYVSFGG